MTTPQPGGFLSSGLLSPPLSTASNSIHQSSLPSPRRVPFTPGSEKETIFINRIDHRILRINRRYAKKFTLEDEAEPSATSAADERSKDNAKGYKSFKEAGADIERLVDLVWMSGSPTLQIPYLLNLAMLVESYLPAFPPAPKTTVRLLGKLDEAFASMLHGADQDGSTLPGFGPGGIKGVTVTERIRMKGIVERTRIVTVKVMNRSEFEYDEADQGDDAEEGEEEEEEDYDMIEQGFERGHDWDLEIARIYEKTLLVLGDSLTGPSIGIPDS